MACDQLLDRAAKLARVDRSGIKLPGGVRTGQQANQQQRELGVLGIAPVAIGQPIEQPRQLLDDLLVQCGEPFAELGAPERRDADLGEEDAAIAIGGQLDEQEVESAGECTLRVEDVELRAQRRAQVLDHLVDRRDEQVLFRVEVVVDEARREARLGRDALHRGLRDAVLHDGGAEPFDDLTAARAGEAGASHR